MPDASFDFDIFDEYQKDFEAKKPGFGLTTADIEDGNYVFTILPFTDKNGGQRGGFRQANEHPIFELPLQVEGGVEIRHTYWLNKQLGVNDLGADLAILLGINYGGKPIKEVFKNEATEAKLAGVKFRGHKSTNKGKDKSKNFVNLSVICIVSKPGAMPQSGSAFNEFQPPPVTNKPPF